jgi:hypothetical protein
MNRDALPVLVLALLFVLIGLPLTLLRNLR